MRIPVRLLGGVSAILLAVAGVVITPAPAAAAQTIRELQWHLDALRISEAHRISTGKGVVVAVLDSGVAADHPDLAGRILEGYHAANPALDPHQDPDNHGTAVAGMIAARGGGPNRALGIAPDAKILPVGLTLDDFAPSGVEEGIRWAVDHGASVINISNGKAHATQDLVEAVRYALENDVVVVASAGNRDNHWTGVGAPAKIPGVLAVGAVDRNGEVWADSNRGPEMGIAAPGVDIVTLANRDTDGRPGGYIRVPGGTSLAAPIVAGAAALVRSRFPDMSAPDVINRLISTAVDAGPKGRDEAYGFGRLDLLAALTADVPEVSANPLGEPPLPESESEALRGDSTPDLVAPFVIVGVVVLLAIAGIVVLVLLLVWLSRRGRRGPAPNPGPPGHPSNPGPPGPYPPGSQPPSRPYASHSGPPGPYPPGAQQPSGSYQPPGTAGG